MSFAPTPKDGGDKVDIVFVPAIGADPRETWECQTRNSTNNENRQLYDSITELCPAAQVHLYDHLMPEERSLEVKPHDDPTNQKSAEPHAQAELAVAKLGVIDWADRFLSTLTNRRHKQDADKRPILFITHSTGGIVVKHVLSKNPEGNKIAALCVGITFFATPHHGSRILSSPEDVHFVQTKLGLRWEMSETLRKDFAVGNMYLENLNYKFALNVVSLKVYSYVENKTNGLCIVESQSGKLDTPELSFEDEEVIPMDATHGGTYLFKDHEVLNHYHTKIVDLIKGFSAEERAAYYALNRNIITNTKIKCHQIRFGSTQGEQASKRIFPINSSLQEFIEQGPTELISESEHRRDDNANNHGSNKFVQKATDPRRALDLKDPSLINTTGDTKDALSKASSTNPRLELSPPSITPPKSIQTRRQSLKPNAGEESIGSLDPKRPTKIVQFSNQTAHKDATDVDGFRRPQLASPSPLSKGFQWIHVPFCHSGWVPYVIMTISEKGKDPTLYKQLLTDHMWFSQHNSPGHASSHGRFVKSMARFPSSKGADKHNGIKDPPSANKHNGNKDPPSANKHNGNKDPPSTNSGIAFAVYLPYLHWDTFGNMQRRAALIRKRSEQAHACPITPEIASSTSTEDKLIWQHLTSNRPFHCRRTLDQYGYPSLRNTDARDADQILYKRTKPKSDLQSAKVLMVDQLWLWIVDDQTVDDHIMIDQTVNDPTMITFFASNEEEGDHNHVSREGDLLSRIHQGIQDEVIKHENATPRPDLLDFAGLAVKHAVKAMFGNGVKDSDLQVFRIFEEYISMLTEQYTSSFKNFRNNYLGGEINDTNAVQDMNPCTELDALLELRDIEDELKTMQKLFTEQQTCVKDMRDQYLKVLSRPKGTYGDRHLQGAEQHLRDQLSQVEEMIKRAKVAQGAFKELLTMKQRRANFMEAHETRQLNAHAVTQNAEAVKQSNIAIKQNEEAVNQSRIAVKQNKIAAEQSRAIMIFTIFTIIFLPLSFFAAIFGMNTSEWNSPPNNYPTLKNIFMIMILISIVVIIIAFLVAFPKFRLSITRFMSKWPIINMLLPKKRLGAGEHASDPEEGPCSDNENTETQQLPNDRECAKKDL